MRIVVIGLIFAAIIMAGGTAYLLNNYLSSQQAEFAAMVPKEPTTSVLISKADMPAGTVINDGNTEWQPWPEDAVQDFHIVKTRENDPLQNLMKEKNLARRAIAVGDPITKAKLYKSEDPGFMRGSLRPGMRAVAVKGSADLASGGFILPGDRVDLMLTHNLVRRAITQTGAESDSLMALDYTSETFMKDLRVLAIDQKVDEFEGGAALAKTVLLEVTPKQAEIIITARKMGTINLVLRSAEHDGKTEPFSFTTDVEVSPLLSNFEDFMSGNDPRIGVSDTVSDNPESQMPIISGNDEDPLASPEPFLSQTPASPPPLAAAPTLAVPIPSVPTPSPTVVPKKRTITVYRGPGSVPEDLSPSSDDEEAEAEEDQ
ncbi:MAG: Flp pilus assembly protein CpaB [Magnetovibrio sp.]|nr:Flp pilus assembly protein CpaB [Magnetovibrio sp.]